WGAGAAGCGPAAGALIGAGAAVDGSTNSTNLSAASAGDETGGAGSLAAAGDIARSASADPSGGEIPGSRCAMVSGSGVVAVLLAVSLAAADASGSGVPSAVGPGVSTRSSAAGWV